eukprot:675283-Amphidinium_carterae.2
MMHLLLMLCALQCRQEQKCRVKTIKLIEAASIGANPTRPRPAAAGAKRPFTSMGVSIKRVLQLQVVTASLGKIIKD